MSTLYLDTDDEITSAASRIRTVDDTRIAIVLPAGSRVATSRINFRLLAREAQARSRSLAIVTPEASARALAASAGLPVFATVGEYEDALAADRAPDPPGGGRDPDAAAYAAVPMAQGQAAEATMPAAIPRAPTGGRTTPRPEVPAARQPGATAGSAGRGRRTGWIVFLAFLALVLLVGGVAGYLLLPSATIVVTPRSETAGPVSLTVRADPNVTAADPANRIVPAQRQPFPVQASGQFQATGKKVDETKATGSVHWTNCDPTASYSVPGGSVVKTGNGTAFTTDGPVFLPVAILTFPGGQPVLSCQGSDVTVTAAKPGTAGNVNANAINQPPSNYNANVIKVSNPAPTSGGTHTETQLVSKADVDGAVATLRKQLDQALTAALGEAVASGTDATVFPDTKSLTDVSYTADPNSYIGQQISSFSLGASATGFATTVDEGAVKTLAADKITSGIGADEQLVPGSVDVKVGPGKVDGQAVVFPVTAQASQVRRLDPLAIRDQVKGLTVDAARSLLAPFGEAQIELTPSWAATIPTFDFRLDVRVEPLASAAPTMPNSSSPAPASSVAGQTPSQTPAGSQSPAAGSPTPTAS